MLASKSNRTIAAVYACTIFLSAFLLFLVQPLLGKFILPWFGGSPAVWTTCMLVFQVLLFAGYAYAHLLNTYLSPSRQALVHGALLLVACCLLPITPDPSWKPTAQDSPVLRIILLTASSVGFPYFLLSSTGPLVQSWFGRSLPAVSPYRLYALSNLGSLLALLAYPFAVERMLSTQAQAVIWSALFGCFALACGVCARLISQAQSPPPSIVPVLQDQAIQSTTSKPSGDLVALWFGLAMLPSVLLLAMTNQVCLDVAVIPFLWVLPLALYLLTFILTFDATNWYSRRWYLLGAAVSIALTCSLMFRQPSSGLIGQLAIYFAALFCCCMVCHGELVRLKPAPQYLTQYYLTISAGGAAGGLSVGLLAPAIFTGYYELHLAFVGFGLLYLAVKQREEQPHMAHGTRWVHRLGGAGVLCGVALLMTQLGSSEGAIAVARNFYGVLRVRETDSFHPQRHRRELVHGRIVHGSQFLSPEKSHLPTTYYGHQSGIGRTLDAKLSDHPRHIGVIGLGIGSLANYGKSRDRLRFYEINPDVVKLAQKHFTSLADCAGTATIVEGDARLVLEHEAPQAFDVLVLDAFSGDAIPVHLLTKEAWQVYLRHLQPGGVLACHISNLHFDLRPVLAGLAEDSGWSYRIIVSEANPDLGTQTAYWCVMSADAGKLARIFGADADTRLNPQKKILWTDDRSNLFEVLR